MRDAGTSPTYVSAEYRPPMSAGLRNTSRSSSRWGMASRLRPGSVMATMNWPGDWSLASLAASAPAIRSHASAWNASGSTVLPDLEATITRVARGSRSSTVAATAAGSVESRIRRVSQSGAEPNVWFSTSGARLLPPMPATTTAVKPASRMPSPKPSSAAIWLAKCSGASSQPRRSPIDVWTRASVLQRLASRAYSRSSQRSLVARVSASR